MKITASMFSRKSWWKLLTTKSSKAPATKAKWHCGSPESPGSETTKHQRKPTQSSGLGKYMKGSSAIKANITLANNTQFGDRLKVDAAEKQAFAKEFYSRQTILKELGEKGQQKLAKSKVAVVGAGGLGTVSSLYLALAGVGYIRLIDQDTIEIHNLHRQILYNTDDLHYPKTEVAAKRLEKQNPLITVEAIPENVHASNVERVLEGVDCVVDGLDNMVTRYLVNRACVKLGIPYVFGAAIGIEGNLSVFAPPETGCLECLMPNLSDSEHANMQHPRGYWSNDRNNRCPASHGNHKAPI